MYIYFFRYVSTSLDYSQSQCTRLDITGETSWKIWTYSDISRRKLYNIHKARHPIIQHLLFSTFTKYRTLSKRPTLLFPDFLCQWRLALLFPHLARHLVLIQKVRQNVPFSSRWGHFSRERSDTPFDKIGGLNLNPPCPFFLMPNHWGWWKAGKPSDRKVQIRRCCPMNRLQRFALKSAIVAGWCP